MKDTINEPWINEVFLLNVSNVCMVCLFSCYKLLRLYYLIKVSMTVNIVKNDKAKWFKSNTFKICYAKVNLTLYPEICLI